MKEQWRGHISDCSLRETFIHSFSFSFLSFVHLFLSFSLSSFLSSLQYIFTRAFKQVRDLTGYALFKEYYIMSLQYAISRINIFKLRIFFPMKNKGRPFPLPLLRKFSHASLICNSFSDPLRSVQIILKASRQFYNQKCISSSLGKISLASKHQGRQQASSQVLWEAGRLLSGHITPSSTLPPVIKICLL